MFERLATGWQLTRQSFRVLWLDKELLVLPLISGMACLLVLLSFAVPLFLSGAMQGLDQGVTENPLAYVVLFAFYFVNYFVIVFFNAALIACAIIRFRGGNPTLGDGLRASISRLPQIAAWAFVSASVGVLLKVIESRSERVGQMVTSLLGMGWTIVSYFVVPALVVEKLGPIDALKRSVSVLRSTWGESLVNRSAIGLIVFLAGLVCCVPAVIGIFLATKATVLGGIGISVLLLVVLALTASAVRSVGLAALYLYAADGTVPGSFDESLLASAFGSRD